MMSLTFGLFTQMSGSGPLGPLVFFAFGALMVNLIIYRMWLLHGTCKW